MYPSWGNYPGQYSQNYGGPGARKPPGVNPAGGFGGFEATSSGSLFSSLQEQHLQQMQQLQMLHQKQLQSVLHHGNTAGAYGAGYTGSPWQPGGSGSADNPGEAVQTFFKQETPTPQTTAPPGQQQPPPPPPQPLQPEPQPPPPESVSSKPPENKDAPKPPDTDKKDQSATGEDKSLPLQEQQQRWYKQHLQNLQKLKQEKAKQNQSSGSIMTTPPGLTGPPLPPSDPPKSKPPPPPPKDEPPGPPPPPNETKSDVSQDPIETVRLQQLQAAAAQWQQVQQQRVGLQYQALMQHHEKLQKILEQYQQLIQQPIDTQSMSTEVQLRHYEMQQQHFTPLFQNWEHSFALWYGQFQTYPHKDQLQDYELQWKQWQEQMNATKAHLQERVAALTPTVQFASGQYNSGTMGKYGQYPGQENQMNQQPALQNPVGAVGPNSQGPQPPAFAPPSESSALPVRGDAPAGMADRPPGPPPCPPPGYNNVQGLSGNNPRFDQQRFNGPPRFDQPQQLFERPPRFDQSQQRFEPPPRFDLPQHRFDGPPRFDPPPQRFDGPAMFNQPRQHFESPPRFDQPRQRFDGPPRFDQPRQRFDGPQRFEQPPFGQQSRHEQLQRHPGPTPNFERPPVPQQKPQQGHQPKPEIETKQAASIEIKTPGKPDVQLKPGKDRKNSGPDVKPGSEDLTDDNLLENEGFFVQNDPIPQTAGANEKEKDSSVDGGSDKSITPKPLKSSSSTNAISSVESASSPVNKLVKPDDIETNKEAPAIENPPKSQNDPQKPVEMNSRPETLRPVTGRGRGQPPVSADMRGRGRGQRGHGDFRGQNTMSHGKDIEEMSYGYQPPEEDMGISEEQQDYYWQDPSYEEYGCEESEEPAEEMWMPEDNYYPPEEEYYEEPMGRPPMGRGGHSLMRGGPPMTRGGPPMMRGGHPSMRGSPQMMRGGISMMRGGPPMSRGGPPMARGGPPMARGGPPMARGGPPMARGGPPMARGGPPMARGGPPMAMARGGPPMARGGPPMARGGPPMGRGGPPMGRGGPPIGRGGLPMGRGEPHDMHWEDPQSSEYYEEDESYWEEVRPPVRGMRPPFPPGHRRPPPGHPAFMRGRGRPPHPLHGPVDHGLMEHQYSDDIETDPAGHPVHHVHDPHGLPMHPDVGRGRRRVPPPPHEIIETMEEPFYDDEMKREGEWQPPHGRGHPPPPHDRGGIRRRPVGRGMVRGGMWRPGPEHEEFKEGYREGFVEDYSLGEDGYRHRPPLDYPADGHRHDPEHYDRERGYALPERDFPHRPPEAYGDGPWREEREKDHPYPYDERDRGRGELRIREYRDEPPYAPPAQPPEWDRPSRHAPLPERDFEDSRPRYEHRDEPSLDKLPSSYPVTPVTNLPESSVESQGTNSGNVLALSQRQHEIILKAAQELKLIREMQEGKTPGPEPQPSKTLPELPAGLLGLEIPQDVRNVLKGMSAAAAAQTPAAEPASWDLKPPLKDYSSSVPTPPAPSVIPKTLDYAHGHESGTTVERISYGERIVLRPDPVPSDRGYEKEPLRDPYSRDPYYERRGDPYLERREYSRERELYREKLPPDYERERFDRERYPPRERDDSTQSMVDNRPPLRPGYREREWDPRDRDRSGSRDRVDDPYRRPGYDRPPYERSGLDRSVPERYPHTSSPLMDRRSYPEDRGPAIPPPLPPPPQPAPRVEKKPEIKNIDDILKQPGRQSRPERIVIILRGLPGSGKSHVAKLIRDKEVECGGAPPRVLVLDDYFMTEVEKVEKDPDTGRRIKTKVLEYEYEPEMEDTYRNSMLKTFKKTLDDGFFPFIILDSVNDRVKHFDQFWSAAKTKGFEVYLAEITADTQTCAKRNVHGRTHKEIAKMSSNWEPSPRHMVRLDVRSLLQDAAIEEVEMEDFNPDEELTEPKKEEEEESDLGYIPKSKWEMDTSEAKLDKLDGLGSSGKRKRDGDMADLEDYLQLPDDYATRMSQPGKKRVRWADLEEQKDADRKRAIGFVVGQTDWERITDESGQLAQRALNRTKYF